MGHKHVYLESLGCARNAVDSETMLARLRGAGWSPAQDPSEADIVIVNTCGFIEPAVNESIDTILQLATLKKEGRCRRLIVAGCLPQRYRQEIAGALPEVDLFIGTGAFDQIVSAVNGDLDSHRCLLPDPDRLPAPEEEIARHRGAAHTAYLKIAEGCSRHCTYCIIPKLRGRQKSRSLEAVVAEARFLVDAGTKELVLVAQDTTAYGRDLTPAVSLDRLLGALSDLSPDLWIRVLYGHPESIDDAFIRTVAERSNICAYFDIPVQHVGDRVLKQMGRNYTEGDLRELFDRIRTAIPQAALRTTLITGFPGETEDDCRKLLAFMDAVQFDHLGVFIYSDAEDLPSHRLGGHVPKKVAQTRYDLLMSHQREISLRNNTRHLHKRYTVLVDGQDEETLFSGRTYFQAPEVDGITYVSSSKPIDCGRFVEVEITDTLEYDLVGAVAWGT